MKRGTRKRVMLKPDAVKFFEEYIDFNSRIEQTVIIPVDGVEISCIVRPLKSIDPAPNQLSLFPDSFLEKSSRKYD